MATDPLTEKFLAALREPNLIIQLDRNLFGGQPLLHLRKPGPTPRSRPIDLVPVLVGGDEGQETHAQMLRRLADAMAASSWTGRLADATAARTDEGPSNGD